MLVNTNHFVGMTEANQNFSKVVRIVDDNGMAVILKNNKPRYILVNFEEYEELQAMSKLRTEKIEQTANHIIDDNLEAFLELAK